MPGMDGFALVRALRADEDLREIRIVLLSARAGEEARVEGLNSGADDYLVKPFSARELVARIGSQLHRARLRREIDARLRASEAYFRAISDNSPVMIWLTDPSGYCTYLNQRWLDFTGQPLGEALGLGWVNAIHADDRDRARARFLADNERRQPFSVDYRLQRHDGSYRWVIDIGMPRFAEDGAFLGYIGSVIDITDRKQAEDRLKLLAGEVDHRAKNMLAVVQAIVRMTRADDIGAFRSAVIGRIAALARAHTLLANSKWEGADLKRLIQDELAAYRGNEAPRTSVSGPPVSLDPGTAQTLAMTFHELATNAVKYGALAAPGGRIAVNWSVDAGGALSNSMARERRPSCPAAVRGRFRHRPDPPLDRQPVGRPGRFRLAGRGPRVPHAHPKPVRGNSLGLAHARSSTAVPPAAAISTGTKAARRCSPAEARLKPAVRRMHSSAAAASVATATNPTKGGQAMKLSSAQIEHTLPQIGARALPDDHPAVSELKGMFGDHTFFLSRDGLQIVETGEPTDNAVLANVVTLANWTSDERTALVPHKPEVTDVVIEVGPEDPGSTG